MLSNISTPLVGMVDAAVVGHLPDHHLLAAVNLGAASISLLFFMFGFLRMGTSGLVAQAFGANDQQALRSTFQRALAIAFVAGTVLALLQGPLSHISAALADSAAPAELISDYLSYRLSAAPLALAAMVTTAVLIAVDRAGAAVAIQIAANGLNMALDVVFVHQLGMTVDGVALASAIAESSACLAGLWMLRGYLRRGQSGPSQSWTLLFKVNRDIFVRSTLLVAVFYSLTAISGHFGSLALAACGVLLNLFYLCSYALDGFAHAAEVQAGHAFGARSPADFRQSIRAATFWALVFAAGMSLCLWLFGEQLIALQSDNPNVRAFAYEQLLWFVFLPLLGVAAFLLDGIFIGTTHSTEMRNGMILATVVYLFALPAVKLWEIHGLWLAFSTFMIARGVILLLYYPRLTRGLASACSSNPVTP
ncbi:MAG: MATE family efflux transporter [Granulosicoccaceae bacterium]